MKWISSVEQMKKADAYAVNEMKVPMLLLMEEAARNIVRKLQEVCSFDDDILFLAGSGNNGGDGFAAARMMKYLGYSVRVFYVGDEDRLTEAAKVNYEMLSAYGVPVLTMASGSVFNHIAEQSEWVVDAIFGTGLDREIQGYLRQIVSSINKLHDDGCFKVLAVDIPSGVEGNTGKIMGRAIKADETVTFCRLKPGLMLYPGKDYAGHVTVADIGIPESIPPFAEARFFMLEDSDIPKMVPERVSRSHKGVYGRVLNVAGSRSMIGAAYFSSSAAYRVGAGLVACAIPEGAAPALLTKLPEAITYPYQEEADPEWVGDLVKVSTVVGAGPGMGRQSYAENVLKKLLNCIPKEKTLLLDADALNMISCSEELEQLVRDHGGNTILTPHMGEASRLMNMPVAEIMADPLNVVLDMAIKYQAVVCLKDAQTLVADPKGRVFFSSNGNNGMSTAGSGDVLAGMILGLCAQGMRPFEGACVGVYLHGAAGDRALKDVDHYGMMAGDILSHIKVSDY